MSLIENEPDLHRVQRYLNEMQQYFANQLWFYHKGISYTYADIRDFKDIVHNRCEFIREYLGLPSYVYKSPDDKK